MTILESVYTAPAPQRAAGDLLGALRRRPAVVATAVAVYLVVTIWQHRAVNEFILSFRGGRDTAAWNRGVALVLGPLAALASGWLIFRALRHPARGVLVGYALLTMALSAVGLAILMAVNTEAVHFAQYAILAMLFFPLTGRLFDAIVAATLAGIVDEGVQYWVHYRHWGIYMDFNDCALNVLGAAYGALTVVVLRPRNATWPVRAGGRRAALIAAGVMLAVCLLLAASGVLVNVAGEEAGWRIVLNRGSAYTTFWTPLSYGRDIHVVRPVEGLVLILALLAIYAPLDAAVARAMRKLPYRDDGSCPNPGQ